MHERTSTTPQENAKVVINIGPSKLDCYLNERLVRSLEGVRVSVELGGHPVWEKTERPRFASFLLGYAPKPLYERRIRKAKEKAQKIAASLQ